VVYLSLWTFKSTLSRFGESSSFAFVDMISLCFVSFVGVLVCFVSSFVVPAGSLANNVVSSHSAFTIEKRRKETPKLQRAKIRSKKLLVVLSVNCSSPLSHVCTLILENSSRASLDQLLRPSSPFQRGSRQSSKPIRSQFRDLAKKRDFPRPRHELQNTRNL